MALGKVNKSVETTSTIVNYIGATKVRVLAVNPTKEKRNELLGINSDKEPVYLSEATDNNGNKYQQVTITMYVEPDFTLEDGRKPIIPVSFYIGKKFKYKNDNSKVQVIDKYGYSAWASKEECENHTPLLSASGNPLKISTSYRPAYEGEIAFIECIKNYLCFDEYLSYINNIWTINPKIEPKDYSDCECSFDMNKLFSGNFEEIVKIPTYAPENEFKMVFGVKCNTEGNLRQYSYTEKTERIKSSYTKIEESINNKKENNGLNNVEIDVKPFRIWKPIVTSFQTAPTASEVPFNSTDMPFGNTVSNQPTPWE